MTTTLRDFGDAATGSTRLRSEVINVKLDGTGKWYGEGAKDLARALASPLGFSWPKRMDSLELVLVTVELGDLTTPEASRIYNPDGTFRNGIHPPLSEYWPESDRQSLIPSCVPFRLVGRPGASSIKGLLWREVQ